MAQLWNAEFTRVSRIRRVTPVTTTIVTVPAIRLWVKGRKQGYQLLGPELPGLRDPQTLSLPQLLNLSTYDITRRDHFSLKCGMITRIQTDWEIKRHSRIMHSVSLHSSSFNDTVADIHLWGTKFGDFFKQSPKPFPCFTFRLIDDMTWLKYFSCLIGLFSKTLQQARSTN